MQDQQALGRKAFTRKVSEDSDSRLEDPMGSKVYRESKAEKFLLNGTLNSAVSEVNLLGVGIEEHLQLLHCSNLVEAVFKFTRKEKVCM